MSFPRFILHVCVSWVFNNFLGARGTIKHGIHEAVYYKLVTEKLKPPPPYCLVLFSSVKGEESRGHMVRCSHSRMLRKAVIFF